MRTEMRMAMSSLRTLARTIHPLRHGKKPKGVTGSPLSLLLRGKGDAGSTPATSTNHERPYEVEFLDLSVFQPVCVSCGRIVFGGGFGFERDGMLHYSCSICEGRVH
jgi:hypothetical protein